MHGWLFRSGRPASGSPVTGPSGSRVDGVGSPEQMLDAGLQHHREGRLPQAESVYRRLLQLNPKNVDALHFLGVAAYQRGEHEEAEDLISKALQLNDSNAPAHN